MKQKGFTVIELIVVTIVLLGGATLFAVQKNNIEKMNRDDQRRTAINAMYYSLEDVFNKENGYYPTSISEKNLTAMDATLFTDPNEIKLGEKDANYKYDPTGCDGQKCTGYKLHADMENEADYVKENRSASATSN